MDKKKTVVHPLIKWRRLNNVSQVRLAEQIGIAPESLCRIERNGRPIKSACTKRAILRLTGVVVK